MRRLALVLALLPLVAACGGGGGKKSQPTTPTTGHADPGRTAVLALFRAATRDDRKALWDVLSTESQKRLGGYDRFKSQGALVMERALAPFADRNLQPFISQSLSQEFGIVAVHNGAKALAFPLRHEGNAWKIETPGPLTFSIISPTPGSSGTVQQIAVQVNSPGVVGDAVIWVDGKLVRPTLAPSQGKATVFANLTTPLKKGLHIAVVYAEEGNDASAEAWTFKSS